MPYEVNEIEIRRGVAILGGINSTKSKGHFKFRAVRDIVVEDIFDDVDVQKFKEETVVVEIERKLGILLKEVLQEGGVGHGYE